MRNLMINKKDLRIRDPFILANKEDGFYYMYGTTSAIRDSIDAKNSFSVYKSRDLENFEEGRVVVDGERLGFWGKYDYWAAEVHYYNGKYYLFGSVKADNLPRATQIFVCDTPDGEFVPLSEDARTPREWECLDGTLYIENGEPYMIFSREWLEVGDGQFWAMKLSEDLSHPIEKPFMLFSASDNKYVTELEGQKPGCYVTDGPFLFYEDGRLNMIWSSFCEGKYQVLRSTADSLRGKWTHSKGVYSFDGGHAMLFTTFEGERMISLHMPNTTNFERAAFIKF